MDKSLLIRLEVSRGHFGDGFGDGFGDKFGTLSMYSYVKL